MAKLLATDVFTPGSFPKYTYVPRNDEKLETRLRDALDTPGQIVSLAGPSKSGKTVLVEKVVGRDDLVVVTGAGITDAAQLWDRILDWLDTPTDETRARTVSGGAAIGAGAKAEAGMVVAKAEMSGTGSLAVGSQSTKTEHIRRRGLAQVVEAIGEGSAVVLLDDFHYMPREVQLETAKQIKEAARRGVKFVTSAVPHRGDDVVRANPELRGRVLTIDLAYWKVLDLEAIATAGYGKLGVTLDPKSITTFATESAGSPQLMQGICLNACFHMGVRKPADRVSKILTDADRGEILLQTAATSNFRSLVDVLDSGPRARGSERKVYRFKDGTEGDVYRCVLRALAADPPRLSFPYDELLRRSADACAGDEPIGSSVVLACTHMQRLVAEKFPHERVLDWDEQKQVLDIPDPYLIFYLRWSGRLTE